MIRAFLLVLVWGAAASAQSPDPGKPNIVFLFADDLGYADVGCYGAKDIATPNIDRLAREGTRFTSFYVAQAVCTASRAALMSGCYPNRVSMAGALNHTSLTGMNPQELLLPEIFKKQGYATACFGKWHLGHQPPFLPTRRGFDRFVGLPYSNDNGPLHPTIRGIPPLPWYEQDKVVAEDPDQSQFTRQLTELSVQFIRENKERPFFLYVPHIMPHVPIFASDKYRNTSQRGLYGDVVQELDASVGTIMQTLKECGIDDNTLVIFTSDNGPFLSYGEHAGWALPYREGKLTAFDGGVRVPGIARWPGKVPAGRVEKELFTTLDLLPTFAALIGAPAKPNLDGVNLLPLLLGKPNAKGRETFLYYAGSELQAVRKGPWKYHVAHQYLTVDGEPGKGGKPANHGNAKPKSITESGIQGIASRHGYRVASLPESLFHLENDPGETKNVLAEHPEVVRELQAILKVAQADIGDTLSQTPGKNVRPAGRVRAPGEEQE